MKTTLLIDADILAFHVAAISERKFDFEGIKCVQADDWEQVQPRVDSWIKTIEEKLNADHSIVCLSSPSDEGFRKAILPSYKANRDYANRPVHLQPIKDYFKTAYDTYQRPTLEADDVMGILSTHPRIVRGRKIIVSEDKDMLTIPGWLFNPRKSTRPHLVTTEQADYWHLYQTLVGDSTDNYKGCPGVGPVKAQAILADSMGPTDWHRVTAAFLSKGLTEEDALLQARVARILRHTDYDFKAKRVRLWSPTTGS